MKPETNHNVIRNMPRQLARISAAGREAWDNWKLPETMRLANRRKRDFKRLRLL